MSKRTSVSKSNPLSPNAPSPITTTIVLAEAGGTDAERVAGADAEAAERARVEPVPGPVDAEDA